MGPATNSFAKRFRRRWIAGLALLIGVGLAPKVLRAAPASEAEAQRLYRSAEFKETAENDIEGAEALYGQAATAAEAQSAVRTDALYRQALCLERLGRLADAAKTLRDALASPHRLVGRREADARNTLARWNVELKAAQAPAPEVPLTPSVADTAPAPPVPASPKPRQWVGGLVAGRSQPQDGRLVGFSAGQTVLGGSVRYRASRAWQAGVEAMGWFPHTEGGTTFEGVVPASDPAIYYLKVRDTAEVRSSAMYAGPTVHWSAPFGRWAIGADAGIGVVRAQTRQTSQREVLQIITVGTGTVAGQTPVVIEQTDTNAALHLGLRLEFHPMERWNLFISMRDMAIVRRRNAFGAGSSATDRLRLWHLLLPSLGLEFEF